MANFDKAFKFMLPHEIIVGKIVYTNDEKDRGEETCYGISRKYHPNWSGWPLVDDYKELAENKQELQRKLLANSDLLDDAYLFFRHNFWDKLYGDEINSQSVANKFFDLTVNIGFKTVLFMQRAIREASVSDGNMIPIILRLDGKMGPNTLAAINRMKPSNLVSLFVNNCIEYYKSRNNPYFENGWIRRALDE